MEAADSTQNVAQELEDVLRIWAQAQSPETDFGPWRMAAFIQPARLRSGQFFHPGELVLCRPASEKAEPDSLRGTPLSVWSFASQDEHLVPPGLIALQTEPFGAEPVAPAIPHGAPRDKPAVAV